MSQFRKIEYNKMLHESLRDFFSVTKAGKLSYLYIYLLCVLWPLQSAWDEFEIWRQKIYLISICKWIIGQLTNLLDYLYPCGTGETDIYITQSTITMIYVPVFAEATVIFAPVFAETTTIFPPTFDDLPSIHPAIIHVPTSIYGNSVMLNDLIATIEKIRPLGLKYITEEII